MNYTQQRILAFDAWKHTRKEIEEDVCTWARQLGPDTEDRRRPPGNQNAKKPEVREIRASAAISNWNVPPSKDINFKLLFREVKAVDPESLDYDDQMRKLPAVRRAWAHFSCFWQH